MPNTVLLIRHAEKPLGDSPPFGVTEQGVVDRESLTPRGWQRAGALVGFFGTGPDPGSSGPARTDSPLRLAGWSSEQQPAPASDAPTPCRTSPGGGGHPLPEGGPRSTGCRDPRDRRSRPRLVGAPPHSVAGGDRDGPAVARAEDLAGRPLRHRLGPRARCCERRVSLPAGPPETPRRRLTNSDPGSRDCLPLVRLFPIQRRRRGPTRLSRRRSARLAHSS
jgi:hypothetical protein